MATTEPEQSVSKDQNLVGLKQGVPPLLSRLTYAAHICGVQSVLAPIRWYQSLGEYFQLPQGGPNYVKTYEARQHLPARYVPLARNLLPGKAC